jgi:cytoskeletal protein CcmA (bactofilin family)
MITDQLRGGIDEEHRWGTENMQQSSRNLRTRLDLADTVSPPLSIGSKVTIVGNIECDGPIAIEGTVHGEVRGALVTISRYGTVTGRIIADHVTVEGGVSGEIYANKLILKPSCDVEGEIYHRELSLEDGSYFDGKSRPHKAPLELAKSSTQDAPPLRLAAS